MILKISERVKECLDSIKSATAEYNDYNTIIVCLRALQAASQHPTKFSYSAEDKKKVIDKLYNLCAKHELRLPTDYVEWGSIEII